MHKESPGVEVANHHIDQGADTAAKNTIDILELIRKQQGGDEALDFLREAVGAVVTAIMEAELSSMTGAFYWVWTPEHQTVRNGYRDRQWDTRAGTLSPAIPKLRTGSNFPTFLEGDPFPRAVAREGAAPLPHPAGPSPGRAHRLPTRFHRS